MDDLASRAFVFQHAYAQAPWTAPSVASLFTSRYPSQLGIRQFGSILAEGETTMAELFRGQGYATGAFLGHWFMVGRGFEQGFEAFHQLRSAPAPKARAERVNEAALAWVDQVMVRESAPRIFLYLHYVEPHTPYTPLPEEIERVWDSDQPFKLDEVNQLIHGTRSKSNLSTADVRRVEAAYDAEVLSLDESLRYLFIGLDSRGLLASSLVVLTAYHGEGFQAYGYVEHAQSLFNELLRVPLIIRVPGLLSRVDIDHPVSLLDVLPTLIDWSGWPPAVDFEGRSLRLLMLRQWPDWSSWIRRVSTLWADAATPIFSERARGFPYAADLDHDQALIVGSSKYITAPSHKETFFDLHDDPDERNAAALSTSTRDDLRSVLQDPTTRIRQRAVPERVAPIDEESRERMRALGYGDQ